MGVFDMDRSVEEKIVAMIESAETPEEKDFWELSYDLYKSIEQMDDSSALRIERDGAYLYIWKGKNSIQFVNTEEKKVGTKEVGEAVVLSALFVRDGEKVNITVCPRSEALQKKMEIMMS